MTRNLFSLEKISVLLGAILFQVSFLAAQEKPYIDGFQQEFFFGNIPDIRAEGLGQANTSLGGSVSGLFFNPANIGSIDDFALDLSTSAPFYVLRNSDYYFAGGAYRVHPKVVVALSTNIFAIGPTGFDVNLDGNRYPVDKPTSTNLTLSAAGEVLAGLHLGVNLNLFSWKLFHDVSAARTLLLDLGLLYELDLPEEKGQLRFGTSLSNAFTPRIAYEAPDGARDTNYFPVIFRIGTTYETEFMAQIPGVAQKLPIGLLGTAEYETVFNSDYRNTIRLGSEVVLVRVLAVRMGYFTSTSNDRGLEINYDRINAFTFGFGVIIPVHQMTKGKAPFTVHLDYQGNNSPRTSDFGGAIPNRRGFGIRILSNLN